MDFITENRVLVEAIKRACAAYDIELLSLSDDWIMRLRKGAQTHFVYLYMFDLNGQASDRIAADKVATYKFLDSARVAAVPHWLVASNLNAEIDRRPLELLLGAGGSVVVKPLTGGRGRLVARFEAVEPAVAFMEDAEEVSWAVSPLVDIVREVRLVVLDGVVELAYEKHDPQMVNGLPMFNLNRGATARGLKPGATGEELRELALGAMAAVGLRLGAVDVVVDRLGRAAVLELNSGFSLEHYALISDEVRGEVVDFYMGVVRRLFGLERRPRS